MNVNGCSILSVMSKFQGGDEEKAEVGGRKGPTTVPWREKVGSPFRSAVLLGLGSSPGIGPCQFLSPRGPDGLRATSQLVGRRDVDNRAMQAHGVVIVDELGDQPPSVLHGQGRRDANALSLQGLEPTLDLTVALEIILRYLDSGRRGCSKPFPLRDGVPP